MFFNSHEKKKFPNAVELAGNHLEVVESYKYLGFVIEKSLSDCKDAELRLNKFYASTNSVLRNFKQVNINTHTFLFNSYCKPDYGLNLWNNKRLFSKAIFKSFEVAYNNALKRILGVPLYASSHITAETCGQLLLKHYIALLQANYFHRILRTNCLLIKMNLPFLKQGYLYANMCNMFREVYDINAPCNDVDVIGSRIIWVQRHEERRRICPYYMM